MPRPLKVTTDTLVEFERKEIVLFSVSTKIYLVSSWIWNPYDLKDLPKHRRVNNFTLMASVIMVTLLSIFLQICSITLVNIGLCMTYPHISVSRRVCVPVPCL
jgi:uncharacterized metal-binding protein